MNNNDLISDDQLVVQYLSGNNSAFETLLLRHKENIFRYIINVVRDEDIANDIFQETFMKIIVNIRRGKYSENGKFVCWAMRIAHNLVIDHFRKLNIEKTISRDDETHQSIDNIVSMIEYNVQDEIMYEDTLKEIEKLMYALPENQKEILYMRFYQDMSFKEIAEILDISINTALGRMRYAVLNMRKMASKYALLN